MAPAHKVAHAKLREGMCRCGECRKCRHRATVARLRDRERSYGCPELVREFPIFAEELASTMRYVRGAGGRR
jgi:hypothetical protein